MAIRREMRALSDQVTGDERMDEGDSGYGRGVYGKSPPAAGLCVNRTRLQSRGGQAVEHTAGMEADS